MIIGRLGNTIVDENRLVTVGAQFNGQMTIGKLGIPVGDEHTYEAWFRQLLCLSSTVR